MEWRVIQVLTRQERKAFDALTEAGFLVYLPCETKRAKVGRVITVGQFALFPGYLFARMTEEDECTVNRVEQVIGVRPGSLSHEAVSYLHQAEEAGAFDQTRKDLQRRFIRGEWVKVRSGHYSGLIGEIISTKGDKRATILAKLFGNTRRLEIGQADLEAA